MNKVTYLFALLAFAAIASAFAGELRAQITTYPYTEGFETQAQGPTTYNPTYTFTNGWTNVTGDNSNWSVDVGGTPSTATGPSVDHTLGTAAGKYVYFETSGGVTGNVCIARSPVFNWASLAAPRITFWYHMFGATMGSMHLDLTETMNAAADGSNTGATFTSATSVFTAAHVGSRIRITSGGNAGNYTIAAFVNSTTVTLATVPAGDLSGQAFIHERLTADIVSGWTDNQDVWQRRRVAIAALLNGGGSVQLFQFDIRGIQGTSFTSDMAFDDVTVDDVPAIEVQPLALVTPVSAGSLSGAETITISVRNNGTAAQSNIPVSYTMNGGTTVSETMAGPIAPGATAQHVFATTQNMTADGAYTFVITTAQPSDGDTSNDTLNAAAYNSFSAPYSTDFESGPGGWTVYGTTTFALGTPAATIINSAYSGTNAWVTNLTGLYNDNENGGVVGPSIDLSAYTTTDPWVFIRVWWNSEFSWDGTVLQSSINGGASWQNVGTFGDPNNWYTDNSIAGNPGGQQEGWSGRAASANGSNGWVLARHQLTGLGGQTSVIFRVAFGSDTTVTDEGNGFDDIFIGSPQEMNVLRGATSIASAGTDNTDIQTSGSNLVYTIENQGENVLNLTGTAPDYVVVTPGTNINTLSVSVQPSSAINGGASSNFTIAVLPIGAGAYDFTVSIANSDFDENPYTFTVSGNAIANFAPTLRPATGTAFSGAAGGPFTLTLNPGQALSAADLELFDADGDPIDLNSISITTAPTGVTAPSLAAGITSGTVISFTGTADATNASGDYVYTVDIDDNVSAAVQITVTITIANIAPTHTPATGITGTGATGNAYTAAVALGAAGTVGIATIADQNTSQTHSVTGTTPTGAPGGSTLTWTFAVVGTSFEVTPASAPVLADIGNFDFTVSVSDSGSTPQVVQIDVRITVSGTAPAITSAAVPASAFVGVLFTHTFTATGNPAPTFAVTTGTLPAWLSLVGGTLSGTPAAGDVGVAGPFTVSAQNGIAPDDTETFSITVSAGIAPIITSTAVITATEGAVYTYTVTATGTPTPALSASGLPAWLTFTPATGVLTGTPAAGDIGTTGSITITATNGVTPDDTQSFTIVVAAAPSGGGGGGGKKDSGGCSADSSSNWISLVAILGVLGLATRLRRARR